MRTVNLNDKEFEKIILKIYKEEKTKLLESKSFKTKNEGNKEEQNEVWGAVARAALPLARRALPHVASYLGGKLLNRKKDDKSTPESTPSPTPAPMAGNTKGVKGAVSAGLSTIKKDPVFGFLFEDLPEEEEKYTEMGESFRPEQGPETRGSRGGQPYHSPTAKTTFPTGKNNNDEILKGLKGTISKIFDKQAQKKTQNKSTDDPLLGSFFD